MVLLIFAGGPGLCRRTEGDLAELCSSGFEENAWENFGNDSSWSRKVFQVRLFSLQMFLRCLWPCRMPQMFTLTPSSKDWSVTSVPTQKCSAIFCVGTEAKLHWICHRSEQGQIAGEEHKDGKKKEVPNTSLVCFSSFQRIAAEEFC